MLRRQWSPQLFLPSRKWSLLRRPWKKAPLPSLFQWKIQSFYLRWKQMESYRPQRLWKICPLQLSRRRKECLRSTRWKKETILLFVNCACVREWTKTFIGVYSFDVSQAAPFHPSRTLKRRAPSSILKDIQTIRTSPHSSSLNQLIFKKKKPPMYWTISA